MLIAWLASLRQHVRGTISVATVYRYVAVQQARVGMFREDRFDITEKTEGSWRVAAAAWLVPIVLAGLFGAGNALGARHHAPPHKCATAGVMIPQHDPTLPGPDEIAASDWLEHLRAEAYSGP